MHHKELRIALVCYGGISLAVYMHGVTKEVWKLARASRGFHDGVQGDHLQGVERVYHALLERLAASGVSLHILPDILTGASAGGINAVFLAQAIHSGQSLEPLTDLWLTRADVDVLLDPDARLLTRFFKYWAVPVVRLLLRSKGNVVSASVAPETRAEVRTKLSRLVRSRWFQPPFGGIGFSRLLAEALDVMATGPIESPLLPPEHPLDLFVTATDFRGHREHLCLNSPAQVEEMEHRLSLGFQNMVPKYGGQPFAALAELVLAARATASFPGAFPALQIAEIDQLIRERGDAWPSRNSFLNRILPHATNGAALDDVALIDGSVLVNAPFAEATARLSARPAQREVDRRFVYIDPHPRGGDGIPSRASRQGRLPGFFPVIIGALSTIPREQPIRDNLEAMERQSNEMARMCAVINALRDTVETAVEKLFGYTLFLDHPSPLRLAKWRDKAQIAAANHAGYAYYTYAKLKFTGVVDALIDLIHQATPTLSRVSINNAITRHLASIGLEHLTERAGNLSQAAVTFLREHDLAHRIRRLRLLAQRLSSEWEAIEGVSERDRQAARDAVYRALALFFDCNCITMLGPELATLASHCPEQPEVVLAAIAQTRDLPGVDRQTDTILAEAMGAMPKPLRRLVLLTYLGFPYYDVVTLPLLRGADVTEFDPVKVDRISPDDAPSIRSGGADTCLRGVEFYNFGAFFSRSYRENDYLWGRLHGAERMIDIVASTMHDAHVNHKISLEEIAQFKREAFLAILDEEESRLTADQGLVAGIRDEVMRLNPRAS